MLRATRSLVISLGFILAATLTSHGSEAPRAALERVIEAYASRTQLTSELPAFDLQTMVEIQDYLALDIGRDYGLVSGYLFDRATQPLLIGLLLENMFSSTGATLQASAGANQVVFLAWAVRINRDLTYPQSEGFSLEAVVAELIPAVVFLDELLPAAQRTQAAALTAVNLGLRYVVLGQPITGVDWSAAGGFHSEILGPKDAVLSEGVGLPGASSDAGALVRLAAEHLHNRGRSLREGDVVVLGRLGEGALLNEARKVTARFQAGRDERRIVFAVRP
ncbi:MAG: hypothetical protein ACO3RT_04830 [Arenicellales bacterium]|nr:hypothetical protein [Gammaproteobacteria bacterium]